MGPVSLTGLSENALLLVDSAPIIYVLENHPELAPAFRPVFGAPEQELVRVAVTNVTASALAIGADALVTQNCDFSGLQDLRVLGVHRQGGRS